MSVSYKVGKDSRKGRYLAAVRNIAAGEVILRESPLVSAQFHWNQLYGYSACENCLKPLETVDENVSRLLSQSTTVPYPECCATDKATQVVCDCGSRYCCEDCKSGAWRDHHAVLCAARNPKLDSDVKALETLWRSWHYPPETASVAILFRLLAIAKLESMRNDVHIAKLPLLKEMCGETTSEEGLSHKILGDEFQSRVRKISEKLSTPAIQESLLTEETKLWVTPAGLQSFFAILSRNGQGIGTSPLSVWVSNVESKLKSVGNVAAEREFDAFADAIYSQLADSAGEFLNAEGSGLYHIQSAANHSCSPNAEIRFDHNDFQLSLFSLKDIAEGDEIEISYLDQDDLDRSRHSRQKMLRENYLFTCGCSKCASEVGQPDETSSSSECDSDA